MARTSKKQMKAEAANLNVLVWELLGAHVNGNTEAGNIAFEIADSLTKQLTCSESFNELLDAWNQNGYRPTLRADVDPRCEVLADLYDYAQHRRGADVVAYRGK